VFIRQQSLRARLNIETNPSLLVADSNAQLDADIAIHIFLTGRNRGCSELGPAPYTDKSDTVCNATGNRGNCLGALQPDGGMDELIPAAATVESSRSLVAGYGAALPRFDEEFLEYRGADDGC
jgi:hypothetical protein